jgi:branched-chain amino acid transport system ATP-binding protein
MLEVKRSESRLRRSGGAARRRPRHHEGRDRRLARIQRRRQDDIRRRPVRARAGLVGQHRIQWRQIAGLGAQAIVDRGLIHVPEGRHMFPNLTVRENLELGGYRRGKANRARNIDHVVNVFPRLKERFDAKGRNAVRRRAADAGDRARHDGRTGTADPRRTVDRPVALACRGNVRPDRQAEVGRADHPACRAERPAIHGNRRPGLRDGKRTYPLSGKPSVLMDDPELQRAYLGLA